MDTNNSHSSDERAGFRTGNRPLLCRLDGHVPLDKAGHFVQNGKNFHLGKLGKDSGESINKTF